MEIKKYKVEDFISEFKNWKEEYGEGWEDVVIERLRGEGIEVEFVG